MESFLDFGGFRLSAADGHLSHNGTALKLTAKATAVLTLLVERAPEVVSRAEFEARVWPDGFIEPSNLTQTIYVLRKELGRHGYAPIETVNRRGYRLSAPVLRKPAQAEARIAARPPRLGWRLVASLAVLVALLTYLGVY
jgi:DNA-binding winged helix-turn-helix (wHTH) protein